MTCNMPSEGVRRVARSNHKMAPVARRMIRNSRLGSLSQPASHAPVRQLSAHERAEMVTLEAAEHETAMYFAYANQLAPS